MDLQPWQLWSAEESPLKYGEIIAVLESVLRRNPNHAGAIHYYIHAVEALLIPIVPRLCSESLSAHARGWTSRSHAGTRFARTGDYADSSQQRRRSFGGSGIRAFAGPDGVYPVAYYSHNLHFLAIAYSMTGSFQLRGRQRASSKTMSRLTSRKCQCSKAS